MRFLDLDVIESRSPLGIWELYRHKLRKADAYLRELFRFLPRVAFMPPRAREVFLWRTGNMVLIPLLGAIGAAAALWTAFAWGAGAMTLTVLAAVALLALVGDRFGIWRDHGAWLVPPLVVLLAAVLVTALILHPFSRQTAHFPKVRTTFPPRPEMATEGVEAA